MVYKRFNIFIIIQVILIAVTCLLFFWSLNKSHLYIARFTFAGFVIVQVIILISYIQNANKSLYRFMELLKSEQVMERFDQKDAEVSSQKLNQIYNEILDILSDVKVEKETEKQYFHHIFKTIGTAIISFKSNGEIELMNNAALKVLKCERMNHIHDFKSKYPSFYQFLIDLKNNENQLFKLLVGDEIIMLSVYCSVIKIKNDEIKTLSFQNIKTELENEELEAWQKLISVLRHEIMNSITPINSLTGTVIRLLSENGIPKTLNQLNNEKIDKAVDSLLAIEKRNVGLLKFVESYRNLTKIPTPVISECRVRDLFYNTETLLFEKLNTNNIQFETSVEPDHLELLADEELISQVLINLLNNSIDALSNADVRNLSLSAFSAGKGVVIRVSDSGCGISQEHLDKIFIPFFTTKEEGTGVGLSISKQIMRMHNASIKVNSSYGKGTEFTLEF